MTTLLKEEGSFLPVKVAKTETNVGMAFYAALRRLDEASEGATRQTSKKFALDGLIVPLGNWHTR
jgi:hypothetical protein